MRQVIRELVEVIPEEQLSDAYDVLSLLLAENYNKSVDESMVAMAKEYGFDI